MQTSTAKNRLPASRFTLIEILVVMTIVGLVLALAIPHFGATPEAVRVHATLNAVRGSFSAASTMAIATGRAVRLFMDFDRHQMRPMKLPGSDPFATEGAPAPPERQDDGIYRSFLVYEMDASARLNTDLVERPENPLRLSYLFYPSGEASGPAIPFVVGDRWFRVDVDRLTGRPVIREETP